MKLVGNSYSVGDMKLKYPSAGSSLCLVVHPLTSPSHGKRENGTYKAEIKDCITQRREQGDEVVWMLDPMILMEKIAKKNIIHRLSANGIEKYNKRIAEALKRQTDAIYSSFGAVEDDSFMITEHVDPKYIMRSLLERRELVRVLGEDLKPTRATITGEIHKPDEPMILGSYGCINMVGGACSEADIPFELGVVLPYDQAFR